MKYFFWTVSFLVILGSCSKRPKVPAGIFPTEKMEDVMFDMMRTGEFLNNFVLHRDSSADMAIENRRWYGKVYEIHKTTKAEFDKSFTYYKDHPILMKEVMDSISKRTLNLPPGQHSWTYTDSMNRRRDSISGTTRPFQRLDSLRNRRPLLKPAK